MKALKGGLVSLKEVAVKRSQQNKLNPILVYVILRVRGRLERATISFNVKHPMILPQHYHVTDLIIKHYLDQKATWDLRKFWRQFDKCFGSSMGLPKFALSSVIALTARGKMLYLGRESWLLIQNAHITPTNNPPFTFVGWTTLVP